MSFDTKMAEVLGAQDGLYSLITRSEQETSVQVIGSIIDYILAAADVEPLVARIAHPETKIVSLTVTEGGYFTRPDGSFDADAADIYAKAYNRDPEFYRFLKTMEVYREVIDPETVMLLGTDNELLRYLERSK